MTQGHLDHPAPHLLRLRFDRPEARGALNMAALDLLDQAIAQVEQSEGELRGLILEGSGTQSFVSGGDLREFASLRTAAQAAEMSAHVEALFCRLERLACWTWASVNGPAYGGGCELCVACDWIVASQEHAAFGWTQTRFDLPPGWGGMTRLGERVGPQHALRLVAMAQILDAGDALALGLVDQVCARTADLQEHVLEQAGALAKAHPAHVISALKNARYGTPDRARRILLEREAFATCWAEESHHEKVRQFLQEKDPTPSTS